MEGILSTGDEVGQFFVAGAALGGRHGKDEARGERNLSFPAKLVYLISRFNHLASICQSFES